MNAEMRPRLQNDVLAVWLAAFVVLVCGLIYVQVHFARAIAASERRAESLYRAAALNARVAGEAKTLHSVEERALTDLVRIARNTSASDSAANVLRVLHDSAKRFGVVVLEVQPESSATKDSPYLRSAGMAIRVRGRFRGILRFDEDLSHHATLVSVSNTDMSLSNDGASGGSAPHIDATIHVLLYRLKVPYEIDLQRAPAR